MLEQLARIKSRVQSNFSEDYTLSALRLMIVAWSIFVAILALTIESKIVLAAILAYEVLP
jgi:hypothetical protein